MREAQVILIAKALADPTRLKMLHELRDAGELTCSDVCDRFPQRQPTISHHIKTLAECGLINLRREGQFHVLTANTQALEEFAQAIVSGILPGAERSSADRAGPERTGVSKSASTGRKSARKAVSSRGKSKSAATSKSGL